MRQQPFEIINETQIYDIMEILKKEVSGHAHASNSQATWIGLESQTPRKET